MVDKNLLAPASVEKKLKEIVWKYLSALEFLAGVEHAEKNMEIELKEAEEIGWPAKEQLIKWVNEKKTQLSYQDQQIGVLFEDFYPKYKHFADIVGKKCTGKTIEVWWISVYKDLLVEEALEQFIEQCQDKLVDCEAFLFSLPTMMSRNDAEKDKDNIKRLDYQKQKTENSIEDLSKKLYIFTTLLWSLKK